jgi:prepilin-type N-terminal cleavage/methylation domain-containing protein
MRKGFTLIELSIVLVIIGLIIGGVMKGKDLINGAEQKKIYNTWIKEWQVAYNSYQDRTGAVLDDGADNGGGGTENGLPDGDRLGTTTTVQDVLKAIGLEVPSSNIPSSNGGFYRIKGKYTSQQADMRFTYVDGVPAIIIYYLPTDVAIAFDKLTDGTTDPLNGSFIRQDDRTATTWPDAQTTTRVNVYLKL